MFSILSPLARLALTILLTTPLTNALPPLQAQSQIVTKIENTFGNGSFVPGDSPVKYNNDPNNDLFIIESLDMHPNPCVIESYCGVIIKGHFTESLVDTTPHLSFNVTPHLPDGREGEMAGEDDLCNWVDIIQDSSSSSSSSTTNTQHLPHDPAALVPNPNNPRHKRALSKRKDIRSCPPKKGPATISSTIILLGGWQPVANYTVQVRATEKGLRGGDGNGGGRGGEGRTIFDLRTDFELRYKDGVAELR